MSQMVERVARAISDMIATHGPAGGDDRDLARAAIEAMREPTEAMHIAGQGECMDNIESVDVIYTAMLDAALAK